MEETTLESKSNSVVGDASPSETPPVPFIEFMETVEYKDLLANMEIDYPNISKENAKIAIYGWYSQEIQGIKLPKVEQEEPASGEIVSMDVYSPEEYKEKFPHLMEQENGIKILPEDVENEVIEITN